MEAYELEHERICLDPNARNARHTYVVPSEDKKSWRVQQMLVDPEEDNDWVAEFEVDLAQSRALGEPFLQLRQDAQQRVPTDAEGQPWTADRLRAAMEAYELEHERICLDPNARNTRHTYVVPSEDKKSWRVQQMLVDPEEDNDWVAEFEVDLAQSLSS